MTEEKSWERRTIGEQMDAARNRQASFKLEAEVRTAARGRGIHGAEADALMEQARVAFIFVGGEAGPVQADRKTPWRNEDGGLLSAAEWVHLSLNRSPQSGEGKPVGTFGPSPAPLPDKKKNRVGGEAEKPSLRRTENGSVSHIESRTL